VFVVDVAKAAKLWQDILRTDTGELFKDKADRLLSDKRHDQLAQPAYNGPKYKGRVIFVSMNPGNRGGGESENDTKQYPKLKALRDALPSELVSEFRELNKVLAAITPRWNISPKACDANPL
jgi:hypothetical protein